MFDIFWYSIVVYIFPEAVEVFVIILYNVVVYYDEAVPEFVMVYIDRVVNMHI